MTDKLERVIITSDIHYDHAIPAVMDSTNPKANTPFMNFVKDYDPHHYCDLGDFMDLACISHWNENKPRLTEGKKLKAHYDFCNRWLDKLESNMPSLKTHKRWEGNHEAWIEDMLDTKPALEGLLEIYENLKYEERGVKWVKRREHSRIAHSKLYGIHGDYKDGYMPLYGAKGIASVYPAMNVIAGHTHQNQTYGAMTPNTMLPFQITVLGCLSNINPTWRKNQPSNWSNSFAVMDIENNGNYHLKVINIVNNRFTYDGFLYKS